MPHPETRVASRGRVERRTAEPLDEEVAEPRLRAGEIIRRIHRPEHVVARDIAVERRDEPRDRIFADSGDDESHRVLWSLHADTEPSRCGRRNGARRSPAMPAPRPWHLLPPGDVPPRGRTTLPIVRRGIDHGTVILGDVEPTPPEEPDAAFAASEPVLIPGVLGDALEVADDHVVATWQAFEGFREGARLLPEVEARLEDAAPFLYAGSSFDLEEPREIEKVFVDVPAADTPHGRRIRDLWAKLSWIAEDEADTSLRIRMSFGHEATKDWLQPEVRAAWTDALTARMFPETRLVTDNEVVRGFLGDVLAAPHRLGECIVYSNAPGGGAVFHHDADPGQHGVAIAQLLGATVWLACPRAELAVHVAAVAARIGGPQRLQTAEGVASSFDVASDADLYRLLNATPELTRELAEAERLFVLRPGDVLILPSHGPEHCAWHAVFGVGAQPSLGLSFGIFDAVPEMQGLPPRR